MDAYSQKGSLDSHTKFMASEGGVCTNMISTVLVSIVEAVLYCFHRHIVVRIAIYILHCHLQTAEDAPNGRRTM